MAFGSRSRILAATTAMVLVGSVFAGSPAYAGKPKPKPDPGNNTPAKLTKAMTTLGVLRHSAAFQFIADHNGDTRASGTPGFDKSAQYVEWTMRLAGYRVSTQEFPQSE